MIYNVNTCNLIIMIKVIAPIILFILLIYWISYYWNKANNQNKKIIAIALDIIFSALLIVTTYFVID